MTAFRGQRTEVRGQMTEVGMRTQRDIGREGDSGKILSKISFISVAFTSSALFSWHQVFGLSRFPLIFFSAFRDPQFKFSNRISPQQVPNSRLLFLTERIEFQK